MNKDKIKTTILTVLLVFTVYIPVIPYAAYEIWANTTVTCENVAIPFTSSYVDDDTASVGTTYVKTAGVDGVRNVCKNKHDTVVKDIIVSPFTEQVNAVGTYEEPFEPYVPPPTFYSGGSVCNDGWVSSSTGRGSCSWHGGVAY